MHMEETIWINEAFSAFKKVLAQYMSFQTPDENIAKSRFPESPFMNGILGQLTVPLIDLEAETHVYFHNEFDGVFCILYISYISPMDLEEHNSKHPDVHWYNPKEFVPGRGKCVYEYDNGQNIFTRVILTDVLPMKDQYEKNIQKEKIQAPFNKRRTEVNSPDSNIYTLGKLISPWLEFDSGTNILITWPDWITDMTIRDHISGNKRSKVEIYTISEADRSDFETKHPGVYWYEDIYVPGKEYFRFKYNLATGHLEKSNVNQIDNMSKLFIIKELCLRHTYCECYETTQGECFNYFGGHLKFYGRLSADCFNCNEGDLVVFTGEYLKPIEQGIVCDKNFVGSFENDWFKDETCIIGKRVIFQN